MSLVSDLAAERFDGTPGDDVSTPLDEELTDRVETRLKQPGVTALASRTMADAVSGAEARMIARTDGRALDRAREAFSDGSFEESEEILEALIVYHDERVRKGEDDRDLAQREADRARLLSAHLLVETERYAEAAETLGAISDQTPVGDFVHWLRGRALMKADQPAEAALAFEEAWERDTTLVKPRARVEQAHALTAAGQWQKAREVLDEVIEDFPEYPRRHRLLYDNARALEKLGELDKAASAYQRAWFEFPHKPEGEQAREDMRRLSDKGYTPEPIPRDELFERYRQLRINKHWPLAEELFLELLEEHKTEDGTSEFEHEILMQLALNDYVPQNHREALGWLEQLRDHYEAGHTDGISRETLYKYLTFTYSELGQLDRAMRALEKRTAEKGSTTQKRFKAEFYEEHGYYAKARELYDEIYSSWRKRGWHYTWLLYKTGEFENAYNNLRRLAKRSSGQQRAKYMYWAGRTLERGGKLDEAAELFQDVANAYDRSYYGIQAQNRLVDIEQRRTIDGTLLSHAQGVADSGDEVLMALDHAAESVDTRPDFDLLSYRDPRTVPRTGESNPSSNLSKNRCAGQTPTAQSVCRLAYGGLTDEAREVMRAALAPIRPYAGLLSHGLPELAQQGGLYATLDDNEVDAWLEAPDHAGPDASTPPRRAALADSGNNAPRANYHTDARIYWEGRSESPIAFVKAERGEVIGPLPEEPRAYDAEGYLGGLDRAVAEVGDLFPQLERAQWLRDAGYLKYARWAMRDAALEYSGLIRRGRPRTSPHELSDRRWDYFIDNRRQNSGLWGKSSDEKRYPVPSSADEKRALLERQQEIYDKRDELKNLMLDAMKDVGDYHLVRRATLGTGPWYRHDPEGPMRHKWMQAYPRAFPKKVMKESRKYGVNPYLLWALMTVESSYNPDSISPADAIGLLQVIPRTGIKTAQMLGDEDFGPFDLIEEDVAIEHGAFYFRNLIDKFRGQELLAIIGYNGGPHRVAAWLDKRGRDMPMDEFVEEVPFNEARGYVKKVIRFLNLYMRIYEDVDNLYVGQNMRLDYLPDPNF